MATLLGKGLVGNENPSRFSLPGKPHAQRSLVGYSPWGCKESDMTEHPHTHNTALLKNI